MNATPSYSSRSRIEILSDLASLPSAVQGKICEDRRKLASGETAVYHNLQFWANGKNHSIRIPESKLDDFVKAAANGAKARDLLVELSQADAKSILSSANPLKKN